MFHYIKYTANILLPESEDFAFARQGAFYSRGSSLKILSINNHFSPGLA